MTGKEKALKWIAEKSAAICNHPDVFSCTWIAKDIGEPVRKVRQYMKELEAEGYVKKAHEGGWDAGAGAGVFSTHLFDPRSTSARYLGFRSAYFKKH